MATFTPTATQKGEARRGELRALFGGAYLASFPVGSRVTCTPAPLDTDEDWLIYVSRVDVEALREAGFTQDGSPKFYTGNDNGGFRSWRRGDLNIITTKDGDFFERFMTASDLAKRFNLLDKTDRIALFQAVLYGVRSPNLVQPQRPVLFAPTFEQVPA